MNQHTRSTIQAIFEASNKGEIDFGEVIRTSDSLSV